MKKLSIVIPCFNSAANIPELGIRLEQLKTSLPAYSLEIVLVDDGSADNTYALLEQLSASASYATILVKLTGNFGSYNAFLAGLNYGSGDVYAQLHPDLQDPPEHLTDMLPYWEQGIPFVIGQRVAREAGWLDQLFSLTYHKLIKKIALPHIPDGGYDLIVFDKALRDHVVNMNESNTNLVYLISWLRYPYVSIPITRVERKAGKSQWTFSKKSKLWMDSVVSFSYTPIRMMTWICLSVVLLSVPAWIWLFFTTTFEPGTRLIMGVSLLLFDILLIFASILGEYLWRTLEAARKRPPFVVEKTSRRSN